MLDKIKNFLDLEIELEETSEKHECKHCGKKFHNAELLKEHQNGLCLDKIYSEDLYAWPEAETEKGRVGREGWTRASYNELEPKHTCQKCGKKGNTKCTETIRGTEVLRPFLVKTSGEEEGLYCWSCGRIIQRRNDEQAKIEARKE